MSNRDVTWFKYLKHCLVCQNRHVTWFKYLNHWILFCQTCMYHSLNMFFQSWEAWYILPTYEQILTITKFVSSKFVARMKRNRQLNTMHYCPWLDVIMQKIYNILILLFSIFTCTNSKGRLRYRYTNTSLILQSYL
jgi:hypothetical protein